jgi:hypothetical protein
MAIGLAASFASQASADVNVAVSINKDKTINVDENITITDTVTIDVTAVLIGQGAAEAQALANVTNFNNTVTLNHVSYNAVLGDGEGPALSNNIGITQANQAAGNNQNQGNLVAAGVTAATDTFANSQSEVDQSNGEGSTNIQDSSMSASIDGSILNNTGVTQFNQDAGNGNNQTNSVAIAAGIDANANSGAASSDVIVALSEASLGQANTFNRVVEGTGDPREQTDNPATATQKLASITGSINNTLGGIVNVNQAAGNNANQGNLVSVAAFVNFSAAQ